MFNGFLSFGGIEIINAARTRAYVENLLPGFPLNHRTNEYDNIPLALGHEPYASPLLDGADWVDSDRTGNEEAGFGAAVHNYTHGFYGLYPLAITGIGDSTMGATVTEGTLAGGSVGSQRDGTRPIRVRGLLIGENQEAVQSGLTWLRNAIHTNACGLHGDACGYSDLRYFLAPPNVCVPLYATKASNGESRYYGELTAATSPLIGRDGTGGSAQRPLTVGWLDSVLVVGPDGVSRSRLDTSDLDGVIARFGALEFNGSGTIVEYGPYRLRRTNRVTNPTFRVGTQGWTATTGLIARRVPAEGGTYARITDASPSTLRYNWAPDPSFENGDPVLNGWRSAQGITAVVDGTAPQGGTVAVVPATAGGNGLEVSLRGPVDGQVSGTVSFWKKNSPNITVSVLNNVGEQVFTSTLTGLSGAWARVSVSSVPMAEDYILRLSTDGTQELRVDGFLVEDAPTMGTFFTGDTADVPGSQLEYYFIDGSAANPSISRTGTETASVVETAQMGTISGDGVASFAMRSVGGATSVTVELLDEFDVIVGNLTVAPSLEWQRYVLGTNNNLRTRLRFSASAKEFDIKEVMVEAGSTIHPYFDGDSAPASPAYDYTQQEPYDYISGHSGYEVSWVAGENASESIQTWVGTTKLFLQESFRPYLSLDQGSIDNVFYFNAFPLEISVGAQITDIDRTYHRVSATTGVQIIREVRTTIGYGLEVDFIFTAEKPHAYSTQPTEIVTGIDYGTAYLSDELVNRVKNPSGRKTVTGLTRLGAGSGPLLEGSPGAYTGTSVTASAAIAAGGFGVYQTLTVGTDLLPNTEYNFSAYVYGSTTGAHVSASGAGVATVSAGSAPSVSNSVYTRVNKVITTSAAGAVDLYVVNATSATVNGSKIFFKDAMVTLGPNLPDYFDGSSTMSDAYTYSWDAAIDASASRRTLTVAPESVIIDPDLPPLVSPPQPPSIPDFAITPQNEWVRYYFTIFSYAVPVWAKAIPTVMFKTMGSAIRQVRVRFHPNPFGFEREQLAPSDYCGEFLLSYLPANSILTVDGVTQSAYASVAGGPTTPANHLMYGTDGVPMDWPELTCGLEYVMTVDVPPGTDFDNLGLEVFTNRQE